MGAGGDDAGVQRIDHIGGFPFSRAQAGASTLQSRLAMSLLAGVAVTERLTGRADIRIDDGSYGVTSVDLRTAGGDLVMTLPPPPHLEGLLPSRLMP